MIHPQILIYIASYLLVFVLFIFIVRKFSKKKKSETSDKPKWRFGNRLKEAWVQVYDTSSFEEAETIQIRLQEENLDCLVYEQGRKDVHGNSLKGFGIAVPRTSVSRAQNIIARMPV